MADSRSHELILAALLNHPDAQALRQRDLDNMALGEFVKSYASAPAVVDLSERSSIREDTVIGELSRLMLDSGEDPISMLDACCGMGSLPKRIIQSMGEKIGRISYLAVDEHPTSIKSIRVQERDFDGFRSFKLIQREVFDLPDLDSGSIDLIVLNNALHEIPPRYFPKMLSTFNALLNPSKGLLCIVDMEGLPDDEPESLAITWRGGEVEEFLRVGGLAPVVTVHPKLTIVYHARVRFTTSGIDERKMLECIKKILERKLSAAINTRQKLEADLLSNPALLREWIVSTGTIARCAEELHAIAINAEDS